MLAVSDPDVLLLSGEEKGSGHRWGVPAEAVHRKHATVAPSVPEGLHGEPQCRAPSP